MTSAPPAPDRPTARVVLVNWRQPELTIRAARSIEPQLRSGDRLVVVDNGSGDSSVETLRVAGLDVMAAPGNRGFGAGVNTGAAGMTEEALVLLNNDAVAEDGFLDALVAPLGSTVEPRIGATTALLLLSGRWRPAAPREDALIAADGARWTRTDDESGTVLVNSTGNILDRAGNGQDRDWLVPLERLRAEPEVFGLCGGACAIAVEAWKALGGMREDLFMYYEDTDLSWRLRETGWTIRFVEDAVARHDHAASSGTRSEMFRRVNARNRILVAVEHAPAGVVLRAIARSTARAARAGWRGPVAAGVAEGLRGVPRALQARRSRSRLSAAGRAGA